MNEAAGGSPHDLKTGPRDGRREREDGSGERETLAGGVAGTGIRIRGPDELACSIRFEHFAGGRAVAIRERVGDAVQFECRTEGRGTGDGESARSCNVASRHKISCNESTTIEVGQTIHGQGAGGGQGVTHAQAVTGHGSVHLESSRWIACSDTDTAIVCNSHPFVIRTSDPRPEGQIPFIRCIANVDFCLIVACPIDFAAIINNSEG